YSSYHDAPTADTSTLSLHDALPIFHVRFDRISAAAHFDGDAHLAEVPANLYAALLDLTTETFTRYPNEARIRIIRSLDTCWMSRSEEHTSELQSPCKIVCRLLLEKK